MPLALVLSTVIVAYNNLANRWPPFNREAYVPMNLAFAGAMTALAVITIEPTRADLGLQGDFADVALAFVVLGVFAIGAFTIARSRYGHLIADRRIAHRKGRSLAYYALVRIPIGTAVTEEVLFRGVLYAAWKGAGLSTPAAAICASVAFGLWHVSPTINGMRINRLAVDAAKVWAGVTAAVVLTTAAGLLLTWVRIETKGLTAPVFLHAGINSIGALAAVAALRRTRS